MDDFGQLKCGETVEFPSLCDSFPPFHHVVLGVVLEDVFGLVVWVILLYFLACGEMPRSMANGCMGEAHLEARGSRGGILIMWDKRERGGELRGQDNRLHVNSHVLARISPGYSVFYMQTVIG